MVSISRVLVIVRDHSIPIGTCGRVRITTFHDMWSALNVLDPFVFETPAFVWRLL
jgi:hypothetical protein